MDGRRNCELHSVKSTAAPSGESEGPPIGHQNPHSSHPHKAAENTTLKHNVYTWYLSHLQQGILVGVLEAYTRCHGLHSARSAVCLRYLLVANFHHQLSFQVDSVSVEKQHAVVFQIFASGLLHYGYKIGFLAPSLGLEPDRAITFSDL